MKTHEQLVKGDALKAERVAVVSKLSAPLPEEDRQAWMARLVAIDQEREAIEVAASVPPPQTAEDIAAQARQERIREIRQTPGMLGQVGENGERLLGYVELERLRQELQALECGLPVPAPPPPAPPLQVAEA